MKIINVLFLLLFLADSGKGAQTWDVPIRNWLGLAVLVVGSSNWLLIFGNWMSMFMQMSRFSLDAMSWSIWQFQLVRKWLVAIGSYWWLSLTNDQVCVRCAPWERRCVRPTIDLHTNIHSTSLICANLRCLRCLNAYNLLTIYLPTNVPSTLFHANSKCQQVWRKYFLKESVLLCQVLSSAFPSLASCWC